MLTARDEEVVVLVQTGRGDWFEPGFQFETTPPHKLPGFALKMSRRPARPI